MERRRESDRGLSPDIAHSVRRDVFGGALGMEDRTSEDGVRNAMTLRLETDIEQRIVAALDALGYPAPKEGMGMIEAMGLIATALEDLASRKPANTCKHPSLDAELKDPLPYLTHTCPDCGASVELALDWKSYQLSKPCDPIVRAMINGIHGGSRVGALLEEIVKP